MALAILWSLPLTTKAEEAGWVEVRPVEQAYRSYLQRRDSGGWMFAFGIENYRPDSFVSPVDGLTYDEIFDGEFQLPYLEAGYKKNLGPLSFGLLLNYAFVHPSGYANGESRDYTWERKAIKLMVIFDGIADEPRLAPYASFGLYQMGLDESLSVTDLTFSGQTQTGSLMTLGLLIQLNWIEPEASRWAWLSAGVENTYLDFFMSQHGPPSGSDDPDTSSKFNWGAGLRIEF